MTPDTLRFLLPALCHLVVEDKSRKIVVDMKLHETLYTYLSYHWSIFDSFKHWLEQQVGFFLTRAQSNENVCEFGTFFADSILLLILTFCGKL